MSVEALLEQARAVGATVLEAGGATIIVIAGEQQKPGELVSLARASSIAATTTRVLRDAIAAGDLEAFGRQRDRSVRREDLERWIESRRVPATRLEDAHEARIERRIARRKKAR